MNLIRAKCLKKIMPYKQIFFDTVYHCYRLINPDELYEYRDTEGIRRQRPNVESLKLIG